MVVVVVVVVVQSSREPDDDDDDDDDDDMLVVSTHTCTFFSETDKTVELTRCVSYCTVSAHTHTHTHTEAVRLVGRGSGWGEARATEAPVTKLVGRGSCPRSGTLGGARARNSDRSFVTGASVARASTHELCDRSLGRTSLAGPHTHTHTSLAPARA